MSCRYVGAHRCSPREPLFRLADVRYSDGVETRFGPRSSQSLGDEQYSPRGSACAGALTPRPGSAHSLNMTMANDDRCANGYRSITSPEIDRSHCPQRFVVEPDALSRDRGLAGFHRMPKRIASRLGGGEDACITFGRSCRYVGSPSHHVQNLRAEGATWD